MSSGKAGERVATDADLILLSAGTLFHDRYEVVRCMGAGGMGAVYEVVDRSTRRRRALKTMLSTLLTDPDMRHRFKLEATVTADIESEHIVEVFDAGFDDTQGLPFLVMEYLRGENLSELLRRRGRLEPSLVLTLLQQASLALERTHAAGIVHRDLKPENLFLTRRDDGSPRLKLLDFGIAKIVAQSANLATTRSFGTPLYMSPEQVRGDGDIDGRADLYALGQIAFTLLVGRAYWMIEAENPSGLYSLLLRVVEGATEPASARAQRFGVELPGAFDVWFRRATARLPSERFDSASELVDALRRIVSGMDGALATSFRSHREPADGAAIDTAQSEGQIPAAIDVVSEQGPAAKAAVAGDVPEVQTLAAVADAATPRIGHNDPKAYGSRHFWRWGVSLAGIAAAAALASNFARFDRPVPAERASTQGRASTTLDPNARANPTNAMRPTSEAVQEVAGVPRVSPQAGSNVQTRLDPNSSAGTNSSSFAGAPAIRDVNRKALKRATPNVRGGAAEYDPSDVR